MYNPGFRSSCRLLVFLICTLCISIGCGPKVISFSVRPSLTITNRDSVKFNWKIRGTPTLLFYAEDAGDDENPGKQFLTYKLVAHKGNNYPFSTIALTLVMDTSVDYIRINTIRHGDSAVAIGIKDTLLWGTQFMVGSIASNSKRSVSLRHLGKTTQLNAQGDQSAAFAGLTYSGPWEIRTLLSDAEKKDSSLIPPKLSIKAIVIHK
jgi:hypothetical protein